MDRTKVHSTTKRWTFSISLLFAASTLPFEVQAFALKPYTSSHAYGLFSSAKSRCFSKSFIFENSHTSLTQSKQINDSGSSLSTPLSNPALATLDIMALLGFAAVGKASHAPDGSLDFSSVLVTGFPFVASWLLTSPLTGVYQDLQLIKDTASTADIAKESLLQTVKGWALAVPLGCALRGIIKGYVPPLPFVIVTLIATLVFIGGVRLVYSLDVTTSEN